MSNPVLAISQSVSQAMASLLEINLQLLRLNTKPEERETGNESTYALDPAVSLTDEMCPVRIQTEEAVVELSFNAAARLFLKLGAIRQVVEHAEELARG